MKISEIQYKRVDVEALAKKFDAFVDKFIASNNVDEQIRIDEQIDDMGIELSTMGSLSYIRFSLNTRDEFYVKENEYYDAQYPKLSNVANKYAKALLNNKHKDEFFKHFVKVRRVNTELRAKAMDEKIIPDLVKENEIVMEYTKLMGSLMFDYEGKKIPPPLMSAYFTNSDRKVRKNAMQACGKQLNENKEFINSLDDIYDKLVKTRTETANKMGLKSYTNFAEYRLTRNAYSRDDIAKFRANVLKYFVPLVSKIKASVAKKLNLDKIYVYDNAVYTSKEPRPKGTVEEIFNSGAKMYKHLSPELDKLFKLMTDTEAFDVLSREGKWGGGYCTTLDSYKQPFILANFNGTAGDIDVLTHEFGHAFAAYNSFNLPESQRSATSDIAEIHSMSMEFFAHRYMKDFFGDLSDEYIFSHIAKSMTFIPYGTIVDYFQEVCYDKPNMTPAERNKLWLSLEAQFQPHMSNGDIQFYNEGRRWQRQMHIYERPFYYIDYCLAQCVAFQFLALLKKDYDSAFAKYVKLVKLCGSLSFTDLLAECGLSSPFEEQTFIDITQAIEKTIL